MRVGLLSGQVFSPFGEIWPRAAPPEAYMQKSPGKNLTWEKTLAARLIGYYGSVVLCTEARQGIRNWARGFAGIQNWGRGCC